MTEGSNRQRVLDFLNILYSGDIEATLARCTDDIEFIANAPVDILPHMGHRRGKAEMREMWDAVHARYSELRCEVPMLVVEGDKAAAYIRVFFRKSINQRMVQFDIAGFYTLRDGQISQIREIIDTFDLVQQVLERDVSRDPDRPEAGSDLVASASLVISGRGAEPALECATAHREVHAKRVRSFSAHR